MDDSFQELEIELKSLKLSRPSPQLAERLARELAAPPTAAARPRYTTSSNLGSWKWLGWRTAGLAAAVIAIVAVLNFKPQPVPASTTPVLQVAATTPAQPEPRVAAPRDSYRPVAASNVLYDLKDEGLVKVDDATSARRLRYRYLDTYTWKDPRSNASLKWSVPRDEIRLVAATLD